MIGYGQTRWVAMLDASLLFTCALLLPVGILHGALAAGALLLLYLWILLRLHRAARKNGLALAIAIGGTAYLVSVLELTSHLGPWHTGYVALFGLTQALLIAAAIACYKAMPRARRDRRNLVFALATGCPLTLLFLRLLIFEVEDAQTRWGEEALARAQGLKHQGNLVALRAAVPHYQKACEYFRRGRDPSRIDALIELGAAYVVLRADDKAAELFDLAIWEDRERGIHREAGTLMRIAETLDYFGETQRALLYYNRSLALRGANLHGLSLVLYLLNKSHTAIEYARKWEARDEDQERRYWLVKALTWAEQAMRSAKIFQDHSEQRLRLEAETVEREAVYLAAVAVAGLGRSHQARRYVERLLVLGRNSPDALAKAAEVYLKLGDRKNAITYYDRAGSAGNEASLLENAGNGLLRAGAVQKGLALLARALAAYRKGEEQDEEAIARVRDAIRNARAASRKKDAPVKMRVRPGMGPVV